MESEAKSKKIFDGRYEILSIVGRGTSSVVYHARHIMAPNTEVALKVLINRKNKALTSEKLRKEALAMVSSHHKYVVRLDDFHSVGDLCYLSMEYAPEFDLRRYTNKIGGKIKAQQAHLFMQQCVQALDFIHQAGIVHRDIKADNILVMNESEIRIADFDVAALPGEELNLDDLQAGVGTMDYMAPEVLEGKAYDARSDIYALGLTFYELLSGAYPFANVPLAKQLDARRDIHSKALSRISSEVPEYLSRIIMRCLSYNPEKRYRTAHDLLRALDLDRRKDLENPFKQTAPTQSASQVSTAMQTSAPEKIEPAPLLDKAPQTNLLESVPAKEPALETTKESTKTSETKPASLLDDFSEDDENDIFSDILDDDEGETEEDFLKFLEEDDEEDKDSFEELEELDESDDVPASEPAPDHEPQTTVENNLSQESPVVSDLTQDTPQAEIDHFEADKTEASFKESQPETRAFDSLAQKLRQSANQLQTSGLSFEKRKILFVGGAFALLLIVISSLFTDARNIKGDKATTRLASTDSTGFSLPTFEDQEIFFPVLPSGVYAGTINNFVPSSQLPFTLVSLNHGSKLAIIIGMEGFTPVVVEFTDEQKKLRLENPQIPISIASNGVIVKLNGQSVEGELTGNFENVITGDQGQWMARPLK